MAAHPEDTIRKLHDNESDNTNQLKTPTDVELAREAAHTQQQQADRELEDLQAFRDSLETGSTTIETASPEEIRRVATRATEIQAAIDKRAVSIRLKAEFEDTDKRIGQDSQFPLIDSVRRVLDLEHISEQALQLALDERDKREVFLNEREQRILNLRLPADIDLTAAAVEEDLRAQLDEWKTSETFEQKMREKLTEYIPEIEINVSLREIYQGKEILKLLDLDGVPLSINNSNFLDHGHVEHSWSGLPFFGKLRQLKRRLDLLFEKNALQYKGTYTTIGASGNSLKIPESSPIFKLLSPALRDIGDFFTTMGAVPEFHLETDDGKPNGRLLLRARL